jgi:hypothetical protein
VPIDAAVQFFSCGISRWELSNRGFRLSDFLAGLFKRRLGLEVTLGFLLSEWPC